ncbi:MAG TPA: hypothetical protein VG621_01250 [Candidatus Paceibacterota bacterium]|nr:hypothetical protein [Candidatus Paceibacterota bacterium]
MEHFIYCTEQEIIDYLRQFGEGRDSRDTELSEAVRLKRLYEKEFKKPFLVGIPVTEEGLRQMKAGTLTKNETIKKFRKDDTDVDILILDAADSNATPRDDISGDVFQMKRLTDHQFNGDFTASVTSELQKIFSKGYSPSPYLSLYLALNLAPQMHAPDWQALADFCTKSKVPFVRVILGPIKTEKGEELLIELFPRLRTVAL